MFKIEKNPVFSHRVECQRPVDGGFEDASFNATFRLLPDDELEHFDTRRADEERALLRAVIVSLDDIVGADDEPLPYNDGLRDMLIGLAFVRSALIRAYFTAILGARVKN